MSNWLTSMELTLTALVAYFQPAAISATADRVLWSGRLGWRSSALELRATDSSAALHAPDAMLSLGALQVRDFDAAACKGGERAALLVSGKRADHAVAVWIETDDAGHPSAVREYILPAPAVSRPICIATASAVSFGLLLEDRSLVRLSHAGVQTQPDVLGPPRDLREYPSGVFAAATRDGTVVVSMERELVAIRAGGERELRNLEHALVAPAVAYATQNALFALDAGGALLSYTPFESAPRSVFAAPGSLPGGLSVWSDESGSDRGLVWGDRAGTVRWFDGTGVRELVRWQAGVRWPLLAFDVLDLGSPQLVMALDDGSLGLVASDRELTTFRAAVYPIATRTSGPLRLSDQSDVSPASIRLPSGAADRVLPLIEAHAAPIVRSAASVQPGEMLVEYASTSVHTVVSPSLTEQPETRANPDEASAPVDAGMVASTPDVPGTSAGDQAPESRPMFDSGAAYRRRSLPASGANPVDVTESRSARARAGGCAVRAPMGSSSGAASMLCVLAVWAVARRSGRRTRSHLRSSQAVLLELPVQGGATDTQHLCGLGQLTVGVGERTFDRPALHGLQIHRYLIRRLRSRQRQGLGGERCSRRRCRLGERLRFLG